MQKVVKLVTKIIFLFWVIYIFLPSPAETPPLPQSLKSTEPGDTVQIPGVSAYYTNLSRQEVVDFYQKNFYRSSLLGIPLITHSLNHPPEYVKTLLNRNTQQSSYLEEITHPLRESLYVSGFEWENDPFTKPEARAVNKMTINGQEFKAKITIFTTRSSLIPRLIVSFGSILFAFWLIKEARDICSRGLLKPSAKFSRQGTP